MARAARAKSDTGANLSFEAKLWQAADALRNNMDAAEYKHVVLGLIFLKYISDAFEARHAELEADRANGADPEDPDEYRAGSIFWVPKEARWTALKAAAPQPTIGTLVDDAMDAIERDNPSLKGVLPRDYARPGLDKARLGQLINLVSDIALGAPADRAKDTLGRVYEYFLAQFASAEGKQSGQFYTPRHVVRVLVEMLAPYKGRVYDPCCGCGGMFVQSERFIESHAGRIGDISIYGQESNYTTWRLAKMNLAIRGIDAQIAHGDTFHNDRHPDLKADYVLANPPFNDSDWRGELLEDDRRWVYGVPPASQRQLRLGPALPQPPRPDRDRRVRARQRLDERPTSRARARSARRSSRPTSSTAWSPCPASSSTRPRSRSASGSSPATSATAATATGGARRCSSTPASSGSLVDRTHRELSDEEIARIAGTYHAWRGDDGRRRVRGRARLLTSATLDEIRGHGHVLTPGRYVGAADAEEDDEPFDEKMRRLTATLREQVAEGQRLDALIEANLRELGFGELNGPTMRSATSPI